MVFSTIIFLCVFLPLTIILYYLMPAKAKNYYLLFASLMFYAWGEPKFLLVMLLSILCNYGLGMWLASGFKRRRLVVALAVILNMGILFIFKYLTFAMESMQKLIAGFPVWQIALPIGISFYTFQGLSYVIDVYRNSEDASFVQRNPFRLALYISMFPQLIAGPIVRYKDIKDSLKERTHTLDGFAYGASRFIIGLSKKAILANQMGQLASQIQSMDTQILSTPAAWLGAIAYTLQIYLDFSGYSDMAIGLGKIFGFDFLENFNYPYISTSVKEFWRRWHISLSGWFRDYLYIPLGGNRRGNVYVNLMLVFLATGIWHGAAWGFLLWGIWHGIFLLIERFISSGKKTDKKSAIANIFGWFYTMLVVVFGWVLFSLVDIKAAAKYILLMLGNQKDFYAYDLRYYMSNQMIFFFVISVLVCIPWKTLIKEKCQKVYPVLFEDTNMVVYFVKQAMLIGLLILCYVFIINSSYNPFIYFRF